METSAQRQAKYRAANLTVVRERERLHKWKSKYGVSLEQWQAMFDKQGGRCAGCMILFGKERRNIPCIDHNHETGVFRGLLCHSCNRSLGLLKESITTLQTLILYLQFQGS
jgi:hypothetical protein